MEILQEQKNGNVSAVLIAGPTASGKSALALAIARELGGEIVNADSMQVYGVLDRLTARPAVDDLNTVPHHLYGHVPPGSLYSTGIWLDQATEAIAGIRARGAVPVVVGGTGLYFRALTGRPPAHSARAGSGSRQRPLDHRVPWARRRKHSRSTERPMHRARPRKTCAARAHQRPFRTHGRGGGARRGQGTACARGPAAASGHEGHRCASARRLPCRSHIA